MPFPPMTLDLVAALAIADEDVTAVVDAYLSDPQRSLVQIGDGYQIDLAEALATHPFAQTLMDRTWAGEDLKRAAVRAAIMMASPEKT